MLESLTDFWKPMKKGASEEKLQPELLQVGSTIGFGFVPQAILSGRRLSVSAINTYQFGEEFLTSFILTQEKDPGVSMIVAESEGEQYLAISRRISVADRIKLFTAADLEAAMSNADTARLNAREDVADYKGWTVASYKREINGLKGRIIKGDFRNPAQAADLLKAKADGQEFEYTLLVSDSNEHAIEIEKYNDNRVEVYATIYRRMNDVGEITHPAKESPRPDLKLTTAAEPAAPKAAKPEPIKLQELTPAPAPVPVREEPKSPPQVQTKNLPEPPVAKAAAPAGNAAPQQKTATPPSQPSNGATQMDSNMKPKLYVQPSAQENYKQDAKAMSNMPANIDADAIECDLRVANKIIDAAIRDQMRLTDVVRHIIELPVANQESVQIPITLSDEDYALLAIRYGITSSDRNAIKRRIIEDLNDFSGDKKAA